jgi:hypothetical protein
MKLMEEAPHVNRIVKTLIDEYAFVMNVRFTLTLRCMAARSCVFANSPLQYCTTGGRRTAVHHGGGLGVGQAGI